MIPALRRARHSLAVMIDYRPGAFYAVMGLIGATVSYAALVIIQAHMPPSPPQAARPTAAYLSPDRKLWTVEFDYQITSFCTKRLIGREFREAGDAEELARQVDPVAVAGAAKGGAVTQNTRRPGSYHGSVTYKVEPGRSGIYTVTLAAAGCDNGWSGAAELYSISYDWTGITP